MIALEKQLLTELQPTLDSLGYELIWLEAIRSRQQILRLFIDHKPSADGPAKVGIEDCVKVSRSLNEMLDQLPLVNEAFTGAYELEVSSPGLDRPLRTPKDYQRFMQRPIKVQTLRPLTAGECGNNDWQKQNPKQKKFQGIVTQVQVQDDSENAVITLQLGNDSERPKKKQAISAAVTQITIPLQLITKAQLIPDFGLLKEGKES